MWCSRRLCASCPEHGRHPRAPIPSPTTPTREEAAVATVAPGATRQCCMWPGYLQFRRTVCRRQRWDPPPPRAYSMARQSPLFLAELSSASPLYPTVPPTTVEATRRLYHRPAPVTAVEDLRNRVLVHAYSVAAQRFACRSLTGPSADEDAPPRLSGVARRNLRPPSHARHQGRQSRASVGPDAPKRPSVE